MEQLTRRNFLVGAGMAGLAATGLAACAPQQEEKKEEKKEEQQQQEEKKETGWLGEAPKIAASDIKKTEDAEIVVVGAGIGGCAAAMGAIDGGAKKVIVLEKFTTSRFGGPDIAGFGSSKQKELGVKCDIDDMIRRYYKHVDMDCNQELIASWAYNSGMVIDKIYNMVKDNDIVLEMRIWPYPDGWDPAEELCEIWPTAHTFAKNGEFTDNFGATITAWVPKLKAKGVDFRYSTPGVELVKNSAGRVTGVIAKNEAGEYVQFNASKGVLLCTGDFGNNPEMMAAFYDEAMCKLSKETNAYTSKMGDAQPKEALNVGDGHKMAIWAGGQFEQGPAFACMAVATWTLCNPFMHVNINGQRFHNEDCQEGIWPVDVLKQPDGRAFIVYDSKWAEDVARVPAWGMWGANPALAGEKALYMGDTIEELAQKMGVPAENLKKTVEYRNKSYEEQCDKQFAMKGSHITSITKAPFRADEIGLYFSTTNSGVRVNGDSQVLDKNSLPIEGLYAVGNVVGERFGRLYYPYFCGMSNGMSVTTGYLGAMHAMTGKGWLER